jgi:hypothetical protein
VTFGEFVDFAQISSQRAELFGALLNASPDIMPFASARQVPAINAIVNGEQDVDLLKLVRTHFRKAGTDRNGTLDGNELVAVVHELAQANKTPLMRRGVETEGRKCLDQFGNDQVVDETGFCKYVGSFFSHMAIWREAFDRYASKDGEMQETDAGMGVARATSAKFRPGPHACIRASQSADLLSGPSGCKEQRCPDKTLLQSTKKAGKTGSPCVKVPGSSTVPHFTATDQLQYRRLCHSRTQCTLLHALPFFFPSPFHTIFLSPAFTSA